MNPQLPASASLHADAARALHASLDRMSQMTDDPIIRHQIQQGIIFVDNLAGVMTTVTQRANALLGMEERQRNETIRQYEASIAAQRQCAEVRTER